MSKATPSTKSTGISIKCHGEFYAREGQTKLTVQFDEIVKAPSLNFFQQTSTKLTGTDDNGKLTFRDTTFLNVRGVLKKRLLPMILNNKHQGRFVRVRSVVIDEIISDDPKETEALPINLMSFIQLDALIKQRHMPLDSNSYVNVDELRTDVMEWLEDPDTFQRNYDRKSKKREEEKSFMEMNNLMPVRVKPTVTKGLASIKLPEAPKTSEAETKPF